jgi:hypothetical protein
MPTVPCAIRKDITEPRSIVDLSVDRFRLGKNSFKFVDISELAENVDLLLKVMAKCFVSAEFPAGRFERLSNFPCALEFPDLSSEAASSASLAPPIVFLAISRDKSLPRGLPPSSCALIFVPQRFIGEPKPSKPHDGRRTGGNAGPYMKFPLSRCP